MSKAMKRFRLIGMGVIAALALTAGVVSPANAVEGLPVEDTTWRSEIVNHAQLRSSEQISEAWDDRGRLVQVWRGADNNAIWVALNHGEPHAWRVAPNSNQYAQTYAAPRIIWTSYGYRAFHTGTDGRIYWAGFSIIGNVLNLGSWLQVPNNVVTHNYLPPAVTALPEGSWYLAWTGASGPDIWTLYYNGPRGSYGAPSMVDDGSYEGVTILSAPAIAYSPGWNDVVLAWRDVSDHLRFARQDYGSGHWVGWPREPGGVTTTETPSIALSDNGYGVISVVNAAEDTLSSVIIRRDGSLQYWFHEANNFITDHPAWLTVVGAVVYYVVTTRTAAVYWKRATDLSTLPPAP